MKPPGGSSYSQKLMLPGKVGLSALERLLEERDRDPHPAAITAFILRDATSAVTALIAGSVFLGLGAALMFLHSNHRALAALALIALVSACGMPPGKTGEKNSRLPSSARRITPNGSP